MKCNPFRTACGVRVHVPANEEFTIASPADTRTHERARARIHSHIHTRMQTMHVYCHSGWRAQRQRTHPHIPKTNYKIDNGNVHAFVGTNEHRKKNNEIQKFILIRFICALQKIGICHFKCVANEPRTRAPFPLFFLIASIDARLFTVARVALSGLASDTECESNAAIVFAAPFLPRKKNMKRKPSPSPIPSSVVTLASQ